MTQTLDPSNSAAAGFRRFHDAAEWLHELGDVPLNRVVMDPWPATERDLLTAIERDKRLMEWIDGTLVEKPMGTYESLVASQVSNALGQFVDPRGLGFVLGEAATIRMAGGRIRSPDVTFVSVDTLPGGEFPVDRVAKVQPTIAVEVLSESNTVWEIRQKLFEYFESGCRLAWVIDPVKRTVAVYDKFSTHPSRVLTDEDTLDGGDVLPGFKVSIAKLFSRTTKIQNNG